VPRDQALQILSSQRVSFAGKTGSGKTFLAQYLLRGFKRLVVIDPKMSLGTPKWNLDVPDRKVIKALEKGEPGRIRYWIPPEISKSGEPVWDSIFEWVWTLGDVAVYIDEMYSVALNGRMSYPLRRLYTQGREPGIGVWASTQRPSYVPLEMFSEAEWMFVFMLNIEEDRKKIARGTGAVEFERPIKDEHGFWLYNQLWESAIYKSAFEPPERRYKAKKVLLEDQAKPKTVESPARGDNTKIYQARRVA
jgi:hypothetical protein